ncbi:head GIN domain-containing protein [Aurantibacter sp.]|uniref:head GIN domain-containing protein n=1 Tax=Aurantibacter sp. TaxID=2807103 RepID=UPI003265830E
MNTIRIFDNEIISFINSLKVVQISFRVIITSLALVLVNSCNSESSSDCLQKSGDLILQEITVPEFSKITVYEKIVLVVKEGTTQKVEIETGENLLNDISVTVEDDRLLLRNDNGCNLFREYGITKIHVTSPNITQIRSSSGLPIQSDGVLNYQSIELLTESYLVPDALTTDSEFNLELNVETVSVVVNGIAYFKLRGAAENLSLYVASGDSRIEAENLLADKVTINHRGSNDLFVNPVESITGIIRGNGDVISGNIPPIVEVDEQYKGKLIFK